ncbi:MAG: hypothetical protein R3C16_03290 [Hyphomonadaceae bacterium]
MDPGARRAALLRALARDWDAKAPDRPVIIAGSTGSVAATRADADGRASAARRRRAAGARHRSG